MSEEIKDVKAKKAFLKKYKEVLDRIAEFEKQKVGLEISMTQCCRSHITGMPRGHGMGDLSDYIVQLAEIQKKIDEEINDLWKVKVAIESAVIKISDPDEAKIIRKKYVELKDWEEIFKDTGYCDRQVYRIHGRALLKLKLII